MKHDLRRERHESRQILNVIGNVSWIERIEEFGGICSNPGMRGGMRLRTYRNFMRNMEVEIIEKEIEKEVKGRS